jgi:hypothetical protein
LNIMPTAALGIRVKSGWASAVLVGVVDGVPRCLHRSRLLLSDPKVPGSSQPYHRGLGSLQKDNAILDPLTRIVRDASLRSLAGFVEESHARGHDPRHVALVVGSTIDPEKVGNEHIRAHAYEARLFRTALVEAAAGLQLPTTVTRERDLPALIAATLPSGATARVTALGREAGRPWRADEKLATLAAWLALARRPLWRCPRCGHEFVTRNIWHSCSRHTLDEHFAGRPAEIRDAFDRFVALAESCGPVTVYAQKTRIVIQARVRFAGAIVRKRWLDVSLWLWRRVDHPRLVKVESFGNLGYGHQFRLHEPADVDKALAKLVREAYEAAIEDRRSGPVDSGRTRSSYP